MFMIVPAGSSCGGSGNLRSSIETLFLVAAKAHSCAYAPYSIFSGANVENSAYPVGTCAEAAAIAAMVTAGQRKIAEILIVAQGDALAMPCGACRQRIHEFAEEDAKIHVAGITGVRAVFTLGALLPAAFGRSRTKADKL